MSLRQYIAGARDVLPAAQRRGSVAMTNLLASLEGFGLGASLIIAIGAQNAFVLRQGLKRRHVFLSAAFCSLSDLLLISAGVFGLGAPLFKRPVTWRVLDALIAAVMFLLAGGLVAGGLSGLAVD